MYISECEEIAESIFNNIIVSSKEQMTYLVNCALSGNEQRLRQFVIDSINDNSNTIVSNVVETLQECLISYAARKGIVL